MDAVNQYQVFDTSTDSYVDCEVCIDTHDEHLVSIEDNWMPALYELAAPLAQEAKDQEHLKVMLTDQNIVDVGWDWSAIVSQEDEFFTRKTFYLLVDGVVEGVLHAKFPKAALLTAGASLVYVDFLAAAPWNRALTNQAPKFKSVGSSLITHTICFSEEMGCGGIIGLHSLIEAEPFYQRIGMIRIGPDPDYENMTYFEFNEAGIRGFSSKAKQ